MPLPYTLSSKSLTYIDCASSQNVFYPLSICWRPTHIFNFMDIFWCCMGDAWNCKCNAGRDSAVAGLTWLWTLNILRVSVYRTQVRNIQHFHTCGNIIQLNKSRIIFCVYYWFLFRNSQFFYDLIWYYSCCYIWWINGSKYYGAREHIVYIIGTQ